MAKDVPGPWAGGGVRTLRCAGHARTPPVTPGGPVRTARGGSLPLCLARTRCPAAVRSGAGSRAMRRPPGCTGAGERATGAPGSR